MRPTSSTRHLRRRVAALGLGAVAVAVIATACTDDADWAAAPLGEPTAATVGSAPLDTSASTTTPSSWLFVMDSATADSVDAPAGFTVTMAAPGHVLAFTDRPARDAHRLRTAWLVQNWDLLFAEDPPNGVLTGLDDSGRAVEIAVELMGVTGDENELVASVRGLGEDVDATAPSRMTDVALFVDDVAGARLGKGDVDNDINTVYSFDAAALVEGYSPHHLDLLHAGEG